MVSFSSDCLCARAISRNRDSPGPARMTTMASDSMTAPVTAVATPGIAQPVAAPLARAAIFLVVTLNPGLDNRTTLRSFCGDLSALLRAVGFRDIEVGLSCVLGFGSEAWDRLFGPPRPAELHPFREIRAGDRHAVSTPGDLLFHIRARCTDSVTSTTAISSVLSTERRIRRARQRSTRS